MSQHHLNMNQGLRASRLSFVSCLAAWLGISALLMSPALAQVNGPGPSPSELFDTVLNLPGDEAVISGEPDQSIGGVPGETTQLNVNDGGTVGRAFEALSGGEVNISGGTVGILFDALSSSEVNISGGTVGQNFGAVGNGFDALAGSVINISGGTILGLDFDACDGSVVNISGGTVNRTFSANSGSAVNISGGSLDNLVANSGSDVNFSGGFAGRFTANTGSQVSISGGGVGGFAATSGSVVELFGGEFRLNGDAFTGQTITLGEDEVFTGTLADGSSFIFASQDLDFVSSDGLGPDILSGVSLSAAPLPVIDVTPLEIDSSVAERLSGLRSGQTLTLVDGGSLPGSFDVVDATINVQGGTLGFGVKAAGSVVNISGGAVGDGFQAYLGSEVNISGGTVGDPDPISSGLALGAGSGSVVNISGGLVNGLEAESGSVVNITGGTVDIGFLFAISAAGLIAESGSEVNISGGNVVGIGFQANEGSEVNISGTQFLLNGELLDALVVGESFTITEPIETLEGTLADGSPFSFGSNELGFAPNFSPGATITVTLDSPVILGDVNLDGVVDFLDIGPFIQVLTTGGFQAEADCNQDGVVNFLDIPVFINILSNN